MARVRLFHSLKSQLSSSSSSQQTLACLLNQFDKRFSQRSSTILALSHDALSERQRLPASSVSQHVREPFSGWVATVSASCHPAEKKYYCVSCMRLMKGERVYG